MLSTLCLTLLVCQVAWGLDANAGLQLQFSKKGLEYAKDFAAGYLEQLLPSIPVSDMHGTVHVTIDVDYDVTEIKFTNFTIHDATFTLIPGSGIQVSITNSQAVIENNWKIKSVILQDNGASILTMNGMTVTAVINVQLDSSGHPYISFTDCVSDIADVDVELIGGIRFFHFLMTDPMKKLSRERMNSQLCPSMKQYIDNWSKDLSKFSFQMDVSQDTVLNYSPVRNLVTTEEEVILLLKGLLYSRKASDIGNFSPVPYSLQCDNTNMICVGLSEYVLNSAAYAFFKSESLSLNLDKLLSGENGFINTSTIADAFPKAADQNFQLSGFLKATKAPLVTLTPNNMTMEVEFSIEITEILPNSVNKMLAKHTMTASISGDFKISAKGNSYLALNLTGSLALNRFQVNPSDTQKQAIGSDSSKSAAFVTYLAEQGLLGWFNDCLNKGFFIPNLPYFPVINPSLKINQGYISICGDVEFVSRKG